MRALSIRQHLQRGAVWLLILALLVLGIGANAPGTASAMPPMPMPGGTYGLACTTNPSATFTLTAKSGSVGTTDGNIIYMWGYAAGDGDFQYPGPVLCVMQGQEVTVVLHNDLPEDVSIIFPGQADVLADGLPAQPVYDGGGNLTSLVKPAAAGGGSVTYSFIAAEPGTYLYYSGTDPVKQVKMGLGGALVVRPMMGDSFVYNSADSEFNPDTEYMLFLSEVDPLLNQAVERGESFNMDNYHPRYWFVNGRTFPDTLASNDAAWLPGQPYSGLIRLHPYDPISNTLPVLVRYLSTGTEDFPFHPHGNHFRIIARDGRLLQGPLGEDLAYEKFTEVVGPGQTLDTLFTWHDANSWDPMTNPIPDPIPPVQDQVFGMLYSGSPYLGMMGAMPPGFMTLNQCGEYYIIAHNHALHQIVSWDVPMAGMATYIRVDPPEPNMCP